MNEVTAPAPPPMVPVMFAFVLDPASEKDITAAQLSGALADLLTQQDRDVGPIYRLAPCYFYGPPGAGGTKTGAFSDVNAVLGHPGLVAVVLQPTLPVPGAAGYHDESGAGGVPRVYVSTAGQSLDDITMTISHELTEERYDPAVNSYSFDVGADRVDIAQELCDQCEDVGYRIGSTLVSDFLMPAGLDSMAKPGDRITFCNSLPAAGTRTAGGYIIFADGTTDPPEDALPAAKRHWNSRYMRRQRNHMAHAKHGPAITKPD